MRPRASAAAGAVLAGLLAAGCSRGPAARRAVGPSVESCAEFGISAIRPRVTTSRAVVAAHGVFAVATILFALLAAVGAR